MKTTLTQQRREAIESGVSNAVDTVVVDKAMTRDEAFGLLEGFVADGLNCHGLSDTVTDTDLSYAKRMFPI